MKHIVFGFLILISLVPVAFLGWFVITAFKSKPVVENTIGTQQQVEKKKNKKGKPKREGFGWLFGVIVVILIGIFLVGAYRLVEYANFKKNGVPATGIVSDKIQRSKKTKDSNASYDVYVTFAVEDKEYTIKSQSSNLWHGDKVDILYMSDNPQKAIVVKGAVLFPVIIMTLSFIAVFVLLGYARTVIVDKRNGIKNSIESHSSP